MDLTTVANKAADSLKSFMAESSDDISRAVSQCLVEAQLQETAPKFKLNLSITLDLQKNQQENRLSWGVRHSLSETSEIEDPNQDKLLK